MSQITEGLLIDDDFSTMLAVFLLDMRLVVTYVFDDVIADYHFLKYREDPASKKTTVFCCGYRCYLSDIMKMNGQKYSVSDLHKLISPRRRAVNYSTTYERKPFRVYPKEWYPCFESEATLSKRMEEVIKRSGEITDLAATLRRDYDNRIVVRVDRDSIARQRMIDFAGSFRNRHDGK